jgi:hypothetical protein
MRGSRRGHELRAQLALVAVGVGGWVLAVIVAMMLQGDQ